MINLDIGCEPLYLVLPDCFRITLSLKKNARHFSGTAMCL